MPAPVEDPPTQPSLRRPLDLALGEELAHIEVRIAQVWQGMSVLSVGLALFLGVRAPRLARLGSLTAVLSLAWFTVVVVLYRRGRATKTLRVATSAVESVLPWLALAMLAVTQGPAYALGSWLPPLLFGGLVVGSTVRLRPAEPLILGVAGAVLFLALYFAWLRPMLPTAEVDNALVTTRVQISRALSLVVGALLAMFVSRTLRRAISRADHTARERELFGKYRILRHVASGGMGTVYEALYCPEGGFERPVAIKRIHPHLAREDRFVRFFRNEAELTARLVHPNIVQVLDFGSVDGTYFLAMEYVDGLTLRTLLRRAHKARIAIAPHVVAHVGRELLAGLAYSHAGARAADGSLLRVIHRDLCPANILVSKNGEVKIADYGVARALREADSAHTRTVTGHTGYMAPEQARAQAIDERTDLFAVGVVLWELLCNKPLFLRGAEGPTLLALIAGEVPRPSTMRADAEPAWDHLLLRTLDREPARRPPTAVAMASELANLERRAGAAEELRELVARVLMLPDPEPREEFGPADDASASNDADLPTRVVS
jgi:serine/threonine-protein kinase